MSIFRVQLALVLSIGVLNCVEVINLGSGEIRCVDDDGAVNSCPENYECVGTRCEKTETADGCVAEALECDALACGNDSCGEPCPEQCGAGRFCSDDQSFCGAYLGYSDDFGIDGEVIGGLIFGHSFVADESGEIKTLGVFAQDFEAGSGPQVELGIYSSESSGGFVSADLRLSATGEFELEPGVNQVPVQSLVQILAGKTYWLLMRTTTITKIRRGDSASFETLIFETADPMPVSLGGETVAADYAYNIFATYEEKIFPL